MSKTLVVIGGGAAGFFCAVNAARLHAGLKVIILEKQAKVLQKVKVSGGGRCNVTHNVERQSELLMAYPRGKNFLKKAFRIFSPEHTMQWFSKHGVPLKKEADGRVFPVSNTSQSIIDCLLKEATIHLIQLRLNAEVTGIKKLENQFTLSLKNEESLSADFVFVSPGGFSKEEHYGWLKDLGHSIQLPVPSLFTFNTPQAPIRDLMGVSVANAILKIEGEKLTEHGPLLITHWGLSGPAVLRLSAWGARVLYERNYQFKVFVNWLAIPENQLREQWPEIRKRQGANTITNRNPFGLPQRLWDFLLNSSGISPDQKWSELPAKEQHKFIRQLTTFELDVAGKTTFKEEFVTCGGINLHEIDPETMQSCLVPGLYFGGEIMDVDGITGGYNFQHAWSSGFIAAKHLAEMSRQN